MKKIKEKLVLKKGKNMLKIINYSFLKLVLKLKKIVMNFLVI